MVLALVATAFIGFGVWVHHMFATGLPQLGQSFFTAASIMIVVPTGAADLQLDRDASGPRAACEITVPFLYAASFFFVFIIGGLTGVMLASVPLDRQVHDTFFVVAHFHYVLIGGSIVPAARRDRLLVPEDDRPDDERAARRDGSFWLLFVGFNLTFFPMHLLGLDGMPRRVYTYPAAMGWGGLNLLASVGAGGDVRWPCSSTSSTSSSACARRRRRRQSVGRAHARVGDVVAAAALQLLRRSRRSRPRAAVAPRTRQPPAVVGLRPTSREVLITARARRRAGSSLQDARAVAVAVADRGGHDRRHVRLVDLHAVGGRLGRDSPTFLCLIGWFWPTARQDRLGRWRRGSSPPGERPVVSSVL